MSQYLSIPQTGKFVVFCGMDGSGKSTIIDRILKYHLLGSDKILPMKHPPREWYENKLIQATYLDGQGPQMTDDDEVIYTSSLRRNIQGETIIPALNDNKTILFHRYIFSLYTYYYFKKSVDFNIILSESKALLEPDLTFLCRISIEEFYRRNLKSELLSFQLIEKNIHDIIECYDLLAQAFNFCVIDTEKTTIQKAAEICVDRINNLEVTKPRVTLKEKLLSIRW